MLKTLWGWGGGVGVCPSSETQSLSYLCGDPPYVAILALVKCSQDNHLLYVLGGQRDKDQLRYLEQAVCRS